MKFIITNYQSKLLDTNDIEAMNTQISIILNFIHL